MRPENSLIDNLSTLNKIVETLNRSVDIRQALEAALTRLVDLMGLETGWIFLQDSASQNRWAGRGYILAAHYNLPPAMAPGKPRPWKKDCDCQTLCNGGALSAAYNEVRCSRLANLQGDRRSLSVHATAPLLSGDKLLGILNVAGPNWDAFSQEALVLLANVGGQMGIALERARLFELMQERRIDEQLALLNMSNQLLRRSELDDLMDYLAQEVRQLLQADACAILLVDHETNQLVFYAATGWRNNPLENPFPVPIQAERGPGQVLYLQEPLLVDDIQSPGQANHFPEWLIAESFRGHAVIPLIADERSIGILMLDMWESRCWNEDDLRFLRLMANQAAIAIEKARLHQEEVKRQRLEEELNVARNIQQSLLPERHPQEPGWAFADLYQPARLVGGDYYDFFDLPGKPRRLGMVIADVADKGVAAALFMALSRSIIRTKALSGPKPATVFSRANKLILKDSSSDLFLTAFYAILNLETGHLIYTNAGHNRPLWYRAATDTIEELETLGIVLGVFDPIKLEEREINIESGDVLVFYTDGVTEAMNEALDLYSAERLTEVIRANKDKTPQEIIEAVRQSIANFSGDMLQSDDLTMFVVKRE